MTSNPILTNPHPNPNPHPTHPHPRPISYRWSPVIQYRRSYRTEDPNRWVPLDKTDPFGKATASQPGNLMTPLDEHLAGGNALHMSRKMSLQWITTDTDEALAEWANSWPKKKLIDPLFDFLRRKFPVLKSLGNVWVNKGKKGDLLVNNDSRNHRKYWNIEILQYCNKT